MAGGRSGTWAGRDGRDDRGGAISKCGSGGYACRRGAGIRPSPDDGHTLRGMVRAVLSLVRELLRYEPD